MTGLSFRVLGPLRVSGDDGEVVVSVRRRRVLLLRLLLSPNEVVPTGQLIDDVWEGAPPPQGLFDVAGSNLAAATVVGR